MGGGDPASPHPKGPVAALVCLSRRTVDRFMGYNRPEPPHDPSCPAPWKKAPLGKKLRSFLKISTGNPIAVGPLGGGAFYSVPANFKALIFFFFFLGGGVMGFDQKTRTLHEKRFFCSPGSGPEEGVTPGWAGAGISWQQQRQP